SAARSADPSSSTLDPRPSNLPKGLLTSSPTIRVCSDPHEIALFLPADYTRSKSTFLAFFDNQSWLLFAKLTDGRGVLGVRGHVRALEHRDMSRCPKAVST
ncbi:MAG: hypothetical protein C5B50_13100, partial [Verrucomicrobia bacterium]